MSREAIDALGAFCPGEGSFFVCEDKDIRFVGCCTVDPCKTDSGACPDDNLYTASFDAGSYNLLKEQECVSDRPEVQWYTCTGANDPPFMGCCAINPCGRNDSCPDSDLHAARLSDFDENAAVFIPGGGGGLSTGATVGVAVGASVAGLLIIAALAWYFIRKRKQQQKTQQQHNASYEPAMQQSPFGSPGPASTFVGSPAMDTKHFPAASPYASTFPSTSPNPQQQMYNQPHPHHVSSYDGSQAGYSYQSPPLQQGAFAPSPYTSGTDVAGYGQALGVALNNHAYHQQQQQQQHQAPVQELQGESTIVSELGGGVAEPRENGKVDDNSR
jgi:preprotein translocase subunit YajC